MKIPCRGMQIVFSRFHRLAPAVRRIHLRGTAVAAAVCGVLIAAAPQLQADSPPVYVAQWGTAGSGNGQFQQPVGMAVDGSGNVYVTDFSNNRIQEFTSTGAYVTQWGSAGSGNGQFIGPYAVAVERRSGNVYVADYGNNRIQKFTSTGGYLTQWGSLGSGNYQLNQPKGVAVDGLNNVYVADFNNSRIVKFDLNGNYITQWGTLGSAGVAVDGSSENVYVSSGGSLTQKFTTAGVFVTEWGTSGAGNGQFSYTLGVAVDGASNVYVADFSNSRVQKFTSTGTYLAQWGTSGSGNGQFNQPEGVAADAAGNIYVSDTFNNRVQKFATVINSFVTLLSFQGRTAKPPCVAGGYFTVTAIWKNNTANRYLTGIAAQVVTLTGGNQLVSQQLDQIGQQGPGPGQSFTTTFQIQLASCSGFAFQVNLTGIPVSSWVYGDASLDGVFNVPDLIVLMSVLNGSAPMPQPGTLQFLVMDVNGDGIIDLNDYTYYLERLRGQISKFPVEP